MRKPTIYVCDVCGKEESSEGYPMEWFSADVRGRDWNEEPLLEKDCCSILCLKNILGEFIDRN